MLDTRGLACPEPVILTKQLVEKNDSKIEVICDSNVSKENVSRFLENSGYKVNITEENSEFIIRAEI